jgi:indolepyruvate ferredoxin oxidoreductase alpha subunit
VELENLVRALGVEHVRVENAQDMRATMKALKELKALKGARVLVSRQACIVNVLQRQEGLPKTKKYTVVQKKCTHCGICINDYCCNAFLIDDKKDVQINEMLCLGCADCVQVCPYDAIVEK